MSHRIRVLIVDDSSFMRMALRRILASDGSIEVVGEAANGQLGVEAARQLRPDVITMDVEMPVLDGIGAARQIVQEGSCKAIIMVSSITQSGTRSTIRALAAGAVDFVSKVSRTEGALDLGEVAQELTAKVRQWGALSGQLRPRSSDQTLTGVRLSTVVAPPAFTQHETGGARLRSWAGTLTTDLVLIGVSTGGPQSLPSLLRAMGTVPCPVVIAQHIPAGFSSGLAEILRSDTGVDVREGQAGQELLPGVVLLIPGGTDGVIGLGVGGKPVLSCRLDPAQPYHPSVDSLFETGVRATEAPLAVVLTGMGNDGAVGGQRFASRGRPVFVQDPSTCVVGGMPSAVLAAGAASHLGSLSDLGRMIREAALARRV